MIFKHILAHKWHRFDVFEFKVGAAALGYYFFSGIARQFFNSSGKARERARRISECYEYHNTFIKAFIISPDSPRGSGLNIYVRAVSIISGRVAVS